MERSLLWSAFALGWVGWLCAAIGRGPRATSPPGSPTVPRLYLGAAFALPALVFLLTLPSSPPFAAGQGLGRGFLLGGVCALLGWWASSRSRAEDGDPVFQTAASTAPWFLAVSAVSLVLLTLWSVAIDALMGAAIGWLAVSTVLALGEGRRTGDRGRTESDFGQHPSSVFRLPSSHTVFAVTACAAAGLAVYHGTGHYEHLRWCAAVVAVFAAVPLVTLLTALPEGALLHVALRLPLARLIARLAGRAAADEDVRRLAAATWRGALAVALFGGLAALVGNKIVPEPHLLYAAVAGVAAALCALWLLRDRDGAESGNTFLALLMVAGGIMAAYEMLAGVGVALALAGLWLVLGTSRTTDDGRQITLGTGSGSRLLAFGAILLLYRLFSTRYTDQLRGVGLSDQYALFGLLAGAALPALAGMVLSRSSRPDAGPGARLLALAAAGAVLLVTPGVLVTLYGPKCCAAFLFGLALSAAGLVKTGDGGRETDPESPLHPFTPSPLHLPFALAAALAVTQWTAQVLPLSSMSRAHKIDALAGIVAAAVLNTLVNDYAGWLRGRRAAQAPEAEAAG